MISIKDHAPALCLGGEWGRLGLAGYGYPPEKQDQAVKIILEQAKLIGDEMVREC